MAHRLISPPNGLPITAIEPLSGPRTIHAGASQSIGNFVQTFGSPFGLWRFRFSFAPMRGKMFRRYRGWVTALHGGANATRWHFFDPDAITFQEAGVDASNFEIATGEPWSNDQPWSNMENWQSSRPRVPADAAEMGATLIQLADVFWGHRLEGGDYIGFASDHFGLYIVTEVIEQGWYRIWPPLRKAVELGDEATLNPTLAMRLEGEDAAVANRGLEVADNLSVTLVEVLDSDVRQYFSETPPPLPAPPWILADDAWNDFGVWDDQEVYP
ncbi:hypothetical protein [Chelativorans sp. Marseille-P2723]|uniref:hypothetical protein n=1 Tax=Chelativorans sp. Marseille-P2723 TaxID=2709133 RepID=UPI00156E3638|nr:hypothetical protein [Chelativorans sp. Marseille-P2723]